MCTLIFDAHVCFLGALSWVVLSADSTREWVEEESWSIHAVSALAPQPRAAQQPRQVPVHGVALASAKNPARGHQCRRYEDARVLIPAPEGGIKTETAAPDLSTQTTHAVAEKNIPAGVPASARHVHIIYRPARPLVRALCAYL